MSTIYSFGDNEWVIAPAAILDVHAQFADVPANGGSQYVDIPIGIQEVWAIGVFGASSPLTGLSAHMLYSEDGGTTFISPWNGIGGTYIRTLHLFSNSVCETFFAQPLIFSGSTGSLIRLLVVNSNTLPASNVSVWLNGRVT